MSNPNGLTDEQIAARPEPFIGMLHYNPLWREWSVKYTDAGKDILLPGEPGCPWPPPEEFRHEWKVRDGAWLLVKGQYDNAARWQHAIVYKSKDGSLHFWGDGDYDRWPINTPAIYIPEEGWSNGTEVVGRAAG